MLPPPASERPAVQGPPAANAAGCRAGARAVRPLKPNGLAHRLTKIIYAIIGKMGNDNMPLAKIDDRGRMQLPSHLRQKMKLKKGDEFVAEDLGEDTIVLKKINLRALLEDAIEKAKSVDLEKPGALFS